MVVMAIVCFLPFALIMVKDERMRLMINDEETEILQQEKNQNVITLGISINLWNLHVVLDF